METETLESPKCAQEILKKLKPEDIVEAIRRSREGR